MKKELKTLTPDTLIEVEVGYDKGGYTLGAMMGFSQGPEPRGYWLYVRVSKITRDSEGKAWGRSFELGTGGTKKFLLEVKRQSPKAAAQAEQLAKQFEAEVVAYLLNKKNLVLAPESLGQIAVKPEEKKVGSPARSLEVA